MDAKIRVMPCCWFLLIRFFVRIDQVIVRAREIRLFHEFPTSFEESQPRQVFMEVLWREKDLTSEVSATASPNVSMKAMMSPMMSNLQSSLSATSTTTTNTVSSLSSHHHHSFSALPPPPMMMKKYTKENIQEIPIINQREGIYPNYRLQIL